MIIERIFASIFAGLVFGAGGGFTLFLWKRYRQTKNVLKNIEKQDLKFMDGDKKIDLVKQIEDERKKGKTRS